MMCSIYFSLFDIVFPKEYQFGNLSQKEYRFRKKTAFFYQFGNLSQKEYRFRKKTAFFLPIW